MRCLKCGMEMEEGTVEGIGSGSGCGYEFTSHEEKKKTGIKGFFTRDTISIDLTVREYPAWHCPKCKKILMWMDSNE